MLQISDRLNRLSESATLAMARKTRELKAEGKDIIGLSLGEPDFDTPDFIKQAAKKAIDNNFTKYTAVDGYADLREAVKLKFKRDNNLDYDIDQIVVSTGAKQSIANVVLSVINPGDEVIIPAPYWVTYAEIVKLAEGTPIVIQTSIDNDFKITPTELKEVITDKTKMMIYSSPCNPTGSFYSKEELAELALAISAYPDLIVLSDEIYEHINFVGQHQSLAQFEEVYEQVVTINGLSKAFAMTGWRLGYIGAPKWLAKACVKMQGQVTSATCSIAQRAAIAALEAEANVTHTMRDAFKSRRDLMVERLNKISGIKTTIPEGAFYVFPDVSSFFGKSTTNQRINNADDLAMYLLTEAEVATVTGSAFGNDNCIRISYAASKVQLTEALNRIEKALNSLH